MEEMMEADSTQTDIGAAETSRKPAANPLLRPGSMVMMTITQEDYEKHYWPKLEQAISQLLTMSPGQYIPISYEQMYSCVYKCVCKQFSERLYTDLFNYMRSYLAGVNEDLQSCNRFYIETKLKTGLSEELTKLFRDIVVDQHISNLLTILEEVSSEPFSVPPATMSALVTNLHSLSPEYAKIRPKLFSRFIPNILPPTCAANLEQYVEETKKIQEEMHSLPGFQQSLGSHSRKRANEEENPVK